jgi:hypothetical protein
LKEIPVNRRKLIAMAVMAQSSAMCTSAQAVIKTDTPPTHRPCTRSDEITIMSGNDEKFDVNMHKPSTDGDPQAMTDARAVIAKAKGAVLGIKSPSKQFDTAGDGKKSHANLGILASRHPVAHARAKQPGSGFNSATA